MGPCGFENSFPINPFEPLCDHCIFLVLLPTRAGITAATQDLCFNCAQDEEGGNEGDTGDDGSGE